MCIRDSDYAVRIQSIAQAGLAYCEDKYGRERYEELRKISAEMISAKTDIPLEKVYDLFCNESGYQTPKLDTDVYKRQVLYDKAGIPAESKRRNIS